MFLLTPEHISLGRLPSDIEIISAGSVAVGGAQSSRRSHPGSASGGASTPAPSASSASCVAQARPPASSGPMPAVQDLYLEDA